MQQRPNVWKSRPPGSSFPGGGDRQSTKKKQGKRTACQKVIKIQQGRGKLGRVGGGLQSKTEWGRPHGADDVYVETWKRGNP